MSKCPNPDCSYELVLLEKRQRYKCARCGKLFSQKKIELKEFIENNKKERERSRKQHKKETHQNFRAKGIIPKLIEELNNPQPPKTKEQYYEENKDKIIQQKREYRKNLSGQQKKEQNEKRKARRYANIEATRLITRINYWRQQQKSLTLQYYENKLYTPYSVGLHDSLPTFQLSYLLTVQ